MHSFTRNTGNVQSPILLRSSSSEDIPPRDKYLRICLKYSQVAKSSAFWLAFIAITCSTVFTHLEYFCNHTQSIRSYCLTPNLCTGNETLKWLLVFKSPVQSGFLTSKWGNCNCNQSRTDPDIGRTELDHLGPVFFG
ncbi:hypothetical protein L208DRAFT_1254213 [Tricholoma matsutake]|nr:hypothetical protein L208DRAFT_1254213 [Tricholoma matsutake 945]